MEPTKTILHEGRFVRLVCRRGWEFVERPGTSGIVIIVAVTETGAIVLVEQRREAVDARVVELPAGLAGDEPGTGGESLEAAARRELREETGYEPDQLALLTAGPPSPGITSEILTFYRATGLRRVGPGGGDATEQIAVHEVPLAEVDAWLEARRRDGLLIDPKVYTGLYFLGITRAPQR